MRRAVMVNYWCFWKIFSSRNTAKKHEEFHLKHNVLNIFQEIVVLRWYLAFFREKVTIFLNFKIVLKNVRRWRIVNWCALIDFIIFQISGGYDNELINYSRHYLRYCQEGFCFGSLVGAWGEKNCSLSLNAIMRKVYHI